MIAKKLLWKFIERNLPKELETIGEGKTVFHMYPNMTKLAEFSRNMWWKTEFSSFFISFEFNMIFEKTSFIYFSLNNFTKQFKTH